MIHIAICDDNASELKQIKTIVEKISLIEYEIHEYTDPNECIQAIEQGMIFDCFLLDILMNKDNGIDIAQKLRDTSGYTADFYHRDTGVCLGRL